jgi:hypothetical protein
MYPIKALWLLLFASVAGLTAALAPVSEQRMAPGQQPQIVRDTQGNLRIIYGSNDQIFCATSTDNGTTFSEPQQVAQVPEMHLGMFRGPQVASSKNYTLVSAMDKGGTIHVFQLNHKTGKWTPTQRINDVENSTPEGLMALAADDADHFYATWLDIRGDKKNKIYYAESTDGGKSWLPNRLVYKGPEGTVCECCRPSIAVKGNNVYVMFRNKLDGSRDLYLTQAKTGGGPFSEPTKLGKDTWKLNACPMDGGGLVVNSKGHVTTAWQRAGKVYTATPGAAEQEIGAGRRCSISSPENPIVTWQQGEDLKATFLRDNKTIEVGKGGFLKTISTKDGKTLCVWETDKVVTYKKI